MNVTDVFLLAYKTVSSNKVRTGITVAIIAFGIMALIGIITAIQAMNQKLTESFSTMGANGFSIRYKDRNFQVQGNSNTTVTQKNNRRTKKSSLGKYISQKEAEAFKELYKVDGVAGISVMVNRNSVVSNKNEKTNPNVYLFGADENYLQLNGFDLIAGRNFSHQDVLQSSNYCLLGYDVATKLFKNRLSAAVNNTIRINNIPYLVLGVLGSRGSTFGFSRDNIIVTSYRSAKRNFSTSNSYVIGVMVSNIQRVEEAMGEAEGTLRALRKLTITEESNFVLDRSDSMAEKAMNSLGFLTISVTVIGLITLIGAAIGLMNIMLVSVTERTKEVGLIKAIGGKSNSIRQQFLCEAVIISLLGAVLGIVLGVLVGNLFSLVLSTGFVVPWNWVLYGVIICTAVGLLAGLYPALKASTLNPIDALRYE